MHHQPITNPTRQTNVPATQPYRYRSVRSRNARTSSK
jgi:hypothetical protein